MYECTNHAPRIRNLGSFTLSRRAEIYPLIKASGFAKTDMSASQYIGAGKTDSQKAKLSAIPWWQWVLGVDLILVLATIAHPHLTPYPGDSLNPLNLASEMNFAAWWSGILLLVFGLLAYELYSVRRDETRTAWLILAFAWAGLSLDEIGSLHERVAIFFGWIAFVPIGLIGAALVSYALYTLLKQRSARGSAAVILLGLFIMSSAVLYEYFERLVDWPSWAVGLRVGAEEGTELLGMFLCLSGVVKQRPHQVWPTGLSRMIPNPHRMLHIDALLIGGFFFHLIVSVLTAMYVEIAERGVPAVWYPTALFLVLAFAALWRFWARSKREPAGLESRAREFVAWSRFALFAAMMSVATLLLYDIQNKSRLIELLGALSNFQAQLIVLLVLFTVFALYLFRRLQRKQTLLLSLLFLVILSGFWLDGRLMQYATIGLFALIIAMVFELSERRGWGETNP